MKKLLSHLLLVLLAPNSKQATFPISATAPNDWYYGISSQVMYGSPIYDGDNFIPDTSTTKHVTAVELYLCTDNAIYRLNVLGDSVPRTIYPTGGCSNLSGTKTTLSFGTYERVVKVDAYHNSNSRWYRVVFTLNNGLIREYNPPHNSAGDTLSSFVVSAGQEFVGFYISDDVFTNC